MHIIYYFIIIIHSNDLFTNFWVINKDIPSAAQKWQMQLEFSGANSC